MAQQPGFHTIHPGARRRHTRRVSEVTKSEGRASPEEEQVWSCGIAHCYSRLTLLHRRTTKLPATRMLTNLALTPPRLDAAPLLKEENRYEAAV